ncbi:MAG: TIR domain-containing protein [Anaerolineae bacterium]|nr:TIR domain-containing protein [Anaerolineae bacterium]
MSTLPPMGTSGAPIFISYPRYDGTEFVTRLRERLLKDDPNFRFWQDRTNIAGGDEWWLEIEHAINNTKCMVLIVTPAALKSAMMAKELRCALREGVHVVPIIGSAAIKIEALPAWLKKFHVLDPMNDAEQWGTLVRTLKNPPSVPRAPFMAEEMPRDFVARPDVMARVFTLLFNPETLEPKPGIVALRGRGGVGKTTLARAICHNPDIRNVFRHGILWVHIGEKPGSLVHKVEDLIRSLSDERPGFNTLEAATAHLAKLLGEREILIVIDDVWNQSHLKPFLQGGINCTRLVTTRVYNNQVPNIQWVPVDAMTGDEARTLLSSGLAGADPRDMETLANRLYKLPFLLKLANRMLHERVEEHGQTLTQAVRFVNDMLTQLGVVALDDPHADTPENRNLAVRATIQVSLNQLKPDEQQRFNELVVFPENIDIPFSALVRLWKSTGNMNDRRVESFCQRLSNLSLLLRFDPTTRCIRLHDEVRAFLQATSNVSKVDLHDQLLLAYPVVRWADLPPQDPYIWDWLAYHLIGGNRSAELINTVKDLRYLVAKIRARSAYAAESDLIAAEKAAPYDVTLRLLRRHVANAGHLFKPGDPLPDVGGTLHSRLQHLDVVALSCTQLAASLPRPFLTATLPLPDLPREAQARAMNHGDAVKACAISHDGDFIVSAGADKLLKIWDARTGEERRTLKGHFAEINGCAISRDGALIVSASADRSLRIWSVANGNEQANLTGHTLGVNGCAFSPDGTLIASASDDKTVRLWDVQTGKEKRALRGHASYVRACVFSPDGTMLVSAAADSTLIVWDVKDGKLLRTLAGHGDGVNSCAFSPDGAFIVSAAQDHTLKVWDARTGNERLTLKGHTAGVFGCAVDMQASVIYSGSDDRTVKGWDARTGALRFSYPTHARTVTAVAACAGRDVFVSASDDFSVRIWDARPAQECRDASLIPDQHTNVVMDCAISGDGALFVSASADKTLKLWDAKRHRVLWTMTGHAFGLRGCAISPDGSFAVSASDDKTLRVWDLVRRVERFALRGHNQWVRACAVGPQNDLIVSASNDNTLMLWDARTGDVKNTLRGHADWVLDCAIAPNGKFIVSASRDRTLRVWDTASGNLLHALNGHTNSVTACAIGPHSDVIVSASEDQTLRVWNAKTGHMQRVLEGHAGHVLGCAISPSGDYVLSCSRDQTVKLWALKSGKCLATLHLDAAVNVLAIHPDNRSIVAGGSRGMYFLQIMLPDTPAAPAPAAMSATQETKQVDPPAVAPAKTSTQPTPAVATPPRTTQTTPAAVTKPLTDRRAKG